MATETTDNASVINDAVGVKQFFTGQPTRKPIGQPASLTLRYEYRTMCHYFEASIKPRFSETDMRGHINNTVIPVWLADGRAALFREELGSRIPTMVVNLNVNFSRELHWGALVMARTTVERIGNSSIRFAQELWQNKHRCVQACTTVVTLDMETLRPIRVPDRERTLLEPYLLTDAG